MSDYTISSGNIFKDLGFPNAEEHLFKVKLASAIANIIHQKNLEPSEIVTLLEIAPQEVKDLKNGQLDRFSQEKLLSYLVQLTQKAEERSSKIKLVDAILNILEQKKLNLSELVTLSKVTVEQIENLKNRQLYGFSQEELLSCLITLGKFGKIESHIPHDKM